jgi:hypothetical protein
MRFCVGLLAAVVLSCPITAAKADNRAKYVAIGGPAKEMFDTLFKVKGDHPNLEPETNDNPEPFVWTADPDTIIAAVGEGTKW